MMITKTRDSKGCCSLSELDKSMSCKVTMTSIQTLRSMSLFASETVCYETDCDFFEFINDDYKGLVPFHLRPPEDYDENEENEECFRGIAVEIRWFESEDGTDNIDILFRHATDIGFYFFKQDLLIECLEYWIGHKRLN